MPRGGLRRGRRRGRRRTMMAMNTMEKQGDNDQDETEHMEQPAQESESSFNDDTAEQLEKLAELRDKGILTDEEFDKKKKQILGI